MIGIGAQLVHRFEWILIFFGLFLLYTSFKMAFMNDEASPGDNPVVRFAKKLYPVVDFLDGQRFFTKRTLPPTYSPSHADPHVLVADPPPAGTLSLRWAMTPLFLCLILIETTDLIFAVDSIPAIFAMTPDPFIIFTSNIFAILGLRSLYFCLAAAIDKFKYLKPALIVILSFVGVKLILMSLPPHMDDIAKLVGITMEPWHAIKVPTRVSLGFIVAVLATAVIASVVRNRKSQAQSPAN
jgi:tellurite resistance protein TerC